MEKKPEKTPAEKAAVYGVLTALAMVLSYVEMLVPLPVGIPGVKPGLANLVVFFALYVMKPKEAFLISMVRILLVSVTFGNMSAFLYSMSGGILSFFIMWLCKEKADLLPVGVSIAGGVFHNVGQLLMASLILENMAVFTYFPVLLTAGCITGGIVGFLGGQIVKYITKN